MEFNVEEMVSLIKNEISQHESKLEVEKVGRVVEVGDGIARIYGLSDAMAGEMLEFECGETAQVFNLEEEYVGAIILGDYLKIKEGEGVRLTGKLLSIPVGDELLGRVIDPLGRVKDGKKDLETKQEYPLERIASGIADRQPVFEPMETGVKSVDSMTPVGRGQRQLIIGDRKTGKTAIAIDAIINQKGKDVVCVYVAIGQKESTVAAVVDTLEKHGAMEYTVVVSAASNEPAPLQYVAPYSGCSIAEYFMFEQKKHTLVVYDDLTKQAAAYRELSLLMRRPPGREAYPGDVFYLHSKLLERSVKLNDELGGGSLTALPIIETQEGEVSAYIPTNVISITDGQIYLVPDLFNAGIRPAVDVGTSVSRVGGNAQISAMRSVAKELRLFLAQYRELEAFAQLGTELDAVAAGQLERGRRLVEILKQGQYKPMSAADQVAIVFAGVEGYLDNLDVKLVRKFEAEFLAHLRVKMPEYYETIEKTGKLGDELRAKLGEAVVEFRDNFVESNK